jgi:hypothetical protein
MMAQNQRKNTQRKSASQRNKNSGQGDNGQARQIGQGYQEAASTGLEFGNRSISEFNRGLQEITDEMADYSKQSLAEVVRGWQLFLDARLFGRLLEIQTRYIENAYQAYASQASRASELYLGLARRAAEPIEQATRRSTMQPVRTSGRKTSKSSSSARSPGVAR